MIPLTLAQIAEITGGVVGDPRQESLEVTGPVVIDSRLAERGSLFVAFDGEVVDGHDFVAAAHDAGAAAALVTRGVDSPHVRVDDAVDALARLAREVVARERSHLTVLALTGSQGKTSVKDLVAQVLESHGATVAPVGSFNNEIGVPLTALGVTASTRFLVLEMGARGIGHIRQLCQIAAPDIAAVLNVGSAHLGEFGTTANITAAKREIVEELPPGGVAVLNADDVAVASMAEASAGDSIVTFGSANPATVRWRVLDLDSMGRPRVEFVIDGERHDVTLPLVGRHHAANAAAATAMAVAAGVPAGSAVASLAEAVARSPMRMERSVRADGVTIINDAYNANPESTAAALRALVDLAPHTGIAMLGGMLELGDSSVDAHRQIGALARRLGVAHVVAIGELARPVADGAGDIAEWVPDFATAVSTISGWLGDETVVLVKASRGERLAWDFDLLTSPAGPLDE